jgi:hypothetical protein
MDELSDVEDVDCCQSTDAIMVTGSGHADSAGAAFIHREPGTDDGEEHWSDSTDNDRIAISSSEAVDPSRRSSSESDISSADLETKACCLAGKIANGFEKHAHRVADHGSLQLSDVDAEDEDIDAVLSDCGELNVQQSRDVDTPTPGIRVGVVQPNVKALLFFVFSTPPMQITGGLKNPTLFPAIMKQHFKLLSNVPRPNMGNCLRTPSRRDCPKGLH